MATLTRAAAAAVLLLLISTSLVAAHAELQESDPAEGATITTPYAMTATFTEEFSPDTARSFMRVEDASGNVVATGGPAADDPTKMTVDLPELDPGTYTVRWQTTTADDAGVERGTFTFNVANAATNEPTTAPTAQSTTLPAATATPAAPAPTPTPTTGGGQSTGTGSDVLLALAVGVVIVGVLTFFLVRRSRPSQS